MKYEETARRLRSVLQERGISQQVLADASGVSKASISQYINGKNIPSSDSAIKLAKILMVEPQWLMGFDTLQMYSPNVEKLEQDEINLIQGWRNSDEETKNMIIRLLAYSKMQDFD